jgi:MvaI/BcnI restriction endonuclease family
MPLRQLTEQERVRLQRLTEKSIAFALIQPTRTGLQKSILDATGSVRNFLSDNEIHNYEEQHKGQLHKKVVSARLVSFDTVRSSQASLYRPETKNGDPRIWFKDLPRFASPDDVVVIFASDDNLALANLSRGDLDQAFSNQTGPLWQLIVSISSKANSVAEELLDRLRRIAARGLIRSVMDARADTAIGRTLETELGIAINSKPEPDYHGIELKSYRAAATKSRENRKTLFGKVPNWTLSKFKGSGEILDAFGYPVGQQWKLNCTVGTTAPNSQGLFFKIDDGASLLKECSSDASIGEFVVWRMKDLHEALEKKHAETFWVSATSQLHDGVEHFQFNSVLHTRRPITAQFDLLIEQGDITMDHLIKRNEKGRVSERGPLFKIRSRSIPLLFPSPLSYDLTEKN